jgi:hypothetical protein
MKDTDLTEDHDRALDLVRDLENWTLAEMEDE